MHLHGFALILWAVSLNGFLNLLSGFLIYHQDRFLSEIPTDKMNVVQTPWSLIVSDIKEDFFFPAEEIWLALLLLLNRIKNQLTWHVSCARSICDWRWALLVTLRHLLVTLRHLLVTLRHLLVSLLSWSIWWRSWHDVILSSKKLKKKTCTLELKQCTIYLFIFSPLPILL